MKKIMFSDKYGLTQAVLYGRKTQTRRLVPKEVFTLQWDVVEMPRDIEICVENAEGDFVNIIHAKFARYKVGEVVAVAQCYNDLFCSGYNIPNWLPSPAANNKMFVKAELMPHHIKITNVRIERLQDISDNDCIAEGIVRMYYGPTGEYYFHLPNIDKMTIEEIFKTPQEAYAFLIDKINGKGTWERNPFVFVYEFELVGKPKL